MEEIIPSMAYEEFCEWSKQNPGTWTKRSMNVAEVAKRIAEAIRAG